MLSKLSIAIEAVKLILFIIEEVTEIVKDVKNPSTNTTRELAQRKMLEAAKYAKDQIYLSNVGNEEVKDVEQPRDYAE